MEANTALMSRNAPRSRRETVYGYIKPEGRTRTLARKIVINHLTGIS